MTIVYLVVVAAILFAIFGGPWLAYWWGKRRWGGGWRPWGMIFVASFAITFVLLGAVAVTK